jgi:hypothetical protein
MKNKKKLVAVFIPENFTGGPVAPLALKQGVILTPKSSTVNFASIFPTRTCTLLNGAAEDENSRLTGVPVWVIYSAENNGTAIQN